MEKLNFAWDFVENGRVSEMDEVKFERRMARRDAIMFLTMVIVFLLAFHSK